MDSSRPDHLRLADFLTHIGYRRTSRKYHMVGRLDSRDWLKVMADSQFGNYDWAYNAGPSHYIAVHSKDRLQVVDWEVFIQIPRSDDVDTRTSGYWELTYNNKVKLKSLRKKGIIRRA